MQCQSSTTCRLQLSLVDASSNERTFLSTSNSSHTTFILEGSFNDISTMKDILAGLEWGDDLTSLNQELANFSLRRGNGNNNTNGSSFLTDPNESISQNDEALGFEFASSITFASTPTSSKQSPLQSKTPIEFRENGSHSEFYPPRGIMESSSSFGFHGLATTNERTFSSSSNSSNTSFIPEGSFNNISTMKDILAGLEWGDDLTSLNQELANFSLRRGNGNNNTNGSSFLTDPNESISQNDEALGIEFASSINYASTPTSSKQSPPSLSKPNTGEFRENCPQPDFYPSGGINTTGYGYHGLSTTNERTFSSSSNSSNTSFIAEGSFNNILRNASERGYYSSKTPSSLLSNSGVWNSPTSAMNHQQQQLPQFNITALPSKLSAKQSIHLMQILETVLEECKESGDQARAEQTCTLMQMIQHHLVSELDSPSSPSSTSINPITNQDSPVDRAAKFHREVAVTADAAFTWSGQLPPRIHRNPTYSCKIFLGGVPWDMTEGALISAFKPFGNIKIEWPGKEVVPSQPKGYAYVIFEHEKQVKLLLQNCFLDYSNSIGGDWYFKMSSKRFRGKDVQVIPWALSDSNYVKCQSAKIDAKKTIFVGALHGMLNAEGLATIMNDLFGGVVYAGIDTDRHKYPIGSGRVTFSNPKSYMKAVSAAFVEIKTKFKKKVQVDPYLEDATCSFCNLQQGPYFCREWSCFRYFCRTCYQTQHTGEAFRSHRPLMRNASKPQGTSGAVTAATFSPGSNRTHRGGSGGNYSQNGSYNGGNNSWNNNNWNNNATNSSYGGYQRRQEYNGGSNNMRFTQMR